MGLAYWLLPALRRQHTFHVVALFVGVTGLGLWIMQGSNAVTGQLLEIGDHMRYFVIVWLPLATLLCLYALYSYYKYIDKPLRVLALSVLALLVAANFFFAYHHSRPFLYPGESAALWQEQQLYAAPLSWLDRNESQPVVIWGNPRNFSTLHVAVLTKHYVLYEEPGNFMLLPTDEIYERFLVSSYFDNLTAESLKNEMYLFAGRANSFHRPKTILRGIKVCRILFFWDSTHDCGVPPTPVSLLGEDFFIGLKRRFDTDIKPNIQTYLKKYNVSYILKDKILDSQYRPEVLGAIKVYSDERFELYRLP
jgi:hypothetical protein